jgi:hypothetical protein
MSAPTPLHHAITAATEVFQASEEALMVKLGIVLIVVALVAPLIGLLSGLFGLFGLWSIAYLLYVLSPLLLVAGVVLVVLGTRKRKSSPGA